MNMVDKLDQILSAKGLTKADLARGADLPYTTIDGIWKKGAENVKRSTLIKIARFLGVSLDYLADDDFEESDPYYFDPEVAAMAEELKNNPEYRILLDASRKMTKKDMQIIISLAKQMAAEDDTHHNID